MLGKLNDARIARRKAEEKYYEAAIEEFSEGKVRKGLMAKAVSECAGDERCAKAAYIRLLAESIQDDEHISQRLADENQRRANFTQPQRATHKPTSGKKVVFWLFVVLASLSLFLWTFG